MRVNMKAKLGYIAVVVFIVALASCGNSRKSKQDSRLNSPQDSAVVIEQETVVVEIDSLAPDSLANRK